MSTPFKIMVLMLLLALVGCKRPTNTASAAAPQSVLPVNPAPEAPKQTLTNEEPDKVTETAMRFTHLSGLHSGLSQDEVMPYVNHYFDTAPFRGDCAKNDVHCYFSDSTVMLELMFNNEGKLYRIRETPDTSAETAAIKQVERPMLDHYFGQSSKRRTKDGETLLEWKKGSESACFRSMAGLFQLEYTDDSLKPSDSE